MSPSRSKISFHQGKGLLHLAQTYPTLTSVVLECIQNAIDSRAQKIMVNVNLSRARVTVRDDGFGATTEKFEKALVSICDSIKRPGSLGQFGLGLISPLGKCEVFTFTSTPKGENEAFRCWTFDTATIKEQKIIDGIPNVAVDNIIFAPGMATKSKGRTPVIWRTEVSMEKVTTDRVVGKFDLQEANDLILERFSEAMLKNGTTILLTLIDKNKQRTQRDVVALRFDGAPIPVLRYQDADSGETIFKLFLARKKAKQGRRGKVSVGIQNNDYRIGFKDFARSAGGLLAPEVIDCFSSGIFEGHILSERCKLNPDRNGFIDNATLLTFCLHLERWVREVGFEHMGRVEDIRKDERYQLLGLRSISVIEEMLKQPSFEHIRKIVRSFKFGTIGTGHTKGRIVGEQDQSSLSTRGPSSIPDRSPNSDQGGQAEPKKPIVGHTPTSVAGPRGTRRRIVKGHSTGLQFAYEEMPGKSALWELDTVHGILSFNTRHPLWEQAERKDRVLMKFQEHIAIQALTMATIPDDWKVICTEYAYEQMPAILFLLMNEPSVSGRRKKTLDQAA